MRGWLSRRGFLGLVGSAAAAPMPVAPPSPARAWIILARNWVYNDEISYPDGTSPRTAVFYDQTQAEAECRRLCEAFYAEQTPEEFEPDWHEYFPDYGRDFDESAVTWEQMRDAGFPEPYLVQELTSVGEAPP
ncbi:MAG TPA: twin-arginine translocation signal domain-containing protein [Planctomycetaceae bacterium]|nr:twin-arginine translocation signal domain-containing protein [Planctomycetaceae bacterium]